MDYIISEIYKNLVPPLTKVEYTSLENSILAQGLFNPIITNQNKIILDGYTRLKICLKNKIKPIFESKQFKSNYEEEIFVIETNLKRRQLNSFQIAELGQSLQKIESKYSKERKISSLKQNKNPLAYTDKKGKTASIVAKNLGLSTTIYEKSLKILKSDDDKIKAKVREGKTTIQKAYSILVNEDKKKSILDELSQNQIKLPKTINLYNKDFRTLKIKSNSVSLIFTDPPYLKENLPIYSDLGDQAMQVLRPGGSLLCFIGQHATLNTIKRLQDTGLTYQWMLAIFHSSNEKSVFFNKNIFQSWKPILWFTKGELKKTKPIKDAILSKKPNKFLHKWAQSSEESDYYIDAFTEKNDIVYDPFLGSGVFGLSAKKLNRQFIGSEIDPKHFQTAKKVISQRADR